MSRNNNNSNNNNNGVTGNTGGSAKQAQQLAAAQQQVNADKPRQTTGERRELRKKYRSLIQNVAENKTELVSPASDGLLKSLRKTNSLYNNVLQAREAVLDSELLALTSQFGLEQAQKFKVALNTFESFGLVNRFKERLSYYSSGSGGSSQRDEDEDDEEVATTHKITEKGWEYLSKHYYTHFHTLPDFEFMYGPINFEPEEKKAKAPRKVTQKDAPVGAAKEAEKITDTTAQTESETTSSRVQAMKHYLEKNNAKSYIDLVADEESFAQTVENIFYFSFLLKDGHVKLSKSDEDMTIIPTQPPEEKDYQSKSAELTHSIVKLDYNMWNELKNVSDLSFNMEEELKEFKKRRVEKTNQSQPQKRK